MIETSLAQAIARGRIRARILHKTIHIDIPDDQEQTLQRVWGDSLDRAALEALIIEGYRAGKLSAAEVGKLLRLGDRWSVNQWLADRRVPLNYTLEDLEADRAALDDLLGKTA